MVRTGAGVGLRSHPPLRVTMSIGPQWVDSAGSFPRECAADREALSPVACARRPRGDAASGTLVRAAWHLGVLRRLARSARRVAQSVSLLSRLGRHRAQSGCEALLA